MTCRVLTAVASTTLPLVFLVMHQVLRGENADWVQAAGLAEAQATQSSEPTQAPQDEAALRKIIADSNDAWNRQDPKAMVAHAAPNHDHINVAGAWRQGKAETEKALAAYFETHRTNPRSATPTIEKIRFINRDVAILVISYKYSDDKRIWGAISSGVWHKINGEWLSEAFQNTLVQSREEAIAQAERATSPMAQTEPLVITPAGSKIDFSGDVAAILQMGADSTDAWNRRDPKALAARISEDHDQIGVTGAWGSGRAQFEKALTGALAATRNNQRRSVAKIRFIAPDVAIVIARREYPNDKETLKSISTAVFHKVNGEWWNEAFQNTYVRPMESSSAPKAP